MDTAAALRLLRSFIRRVAWRVAVIIAVGAVLSLIGWHKAHAYGQGYPEARVQFTCVGVGPDQTSLTAQSACGAVLAAYASSQGAGHSFALESPFDCGDTSAATGSCSAFGNWDFGSRPLVRFSWTRKLTNFCGKGSDATGTGGFCECPLGTKPDAVTQVCKPYSCAVKGSYTAVTQPDVVVENVGPICMGGCTVNPASVKGASDGTLYATWPFVSAGQVCGGKADPDTGIDTGEDKIRDAPIPCGANMCPGSVNGAQVCVACKDTTIKGPSTSASAPPGAASGADPTPIPNAPPGSVTSEQSTSCTQSTCTTTTTYRDKNGAVTGSKTEEKGQESFCKDNPDASICKKGAWGGNCGAYSCDGDAVQCAIAQRIHKTACDWEQVDDVIKARGEAAMSGETRPDGHPFKTAAETSMSFSSLIDRSNPIGGGCPTDTAIAYAGRSWVIPWSQHCDKFQLIGNLMVGVCMLAAAFIVFRS